MVTGCILISTLVFLLGIPIGITSTAIGLKICTITTGIKNYKSIVKKKKEKHDKTVSLAKARLSRLKLLICKL